MKRNTKAPFNQEFFFFGYLMVFCEAIYRVHGFKSRDREKLQQMDYKLGLTYNVHDLI